MLPAYVEKLTFPWNPWCLHPASPPKLLGLVSLIALISAFHLAAHISEPPLHGVMQSSMTHLDEACKAASPTQVNFGEVAIHCDGKKRLEWIPSFKLH